MRKTKDLKAALKLGPYKDVQFMTAKLKAKVVRDWERFIVARLKLKRSDTLPGSDWGPVFKPFSKDLYNHFNQHLGYIAHGSQWGFFGVQFENTADFLRNVKQISEGRDGMGFGMNREHYADVNRSMTSIARVYLAEVESLKRDEDEEDERQALASARRLLESKGHTVS